MALCCSGRVGTARFSERWIARRIDAEPVVRTRATPTWPAAGALEPDPKSGAFGFDFAVLERVSDLRIGESDTSALPMRPPYSLLGHKAPRSGRQHGRAGQYRTSEGRQAGVALPQSQAGRPLSRRFSAHLATPSHARHRAALPAAL